MEGVRRSGRRARLETKSLQGGEQSDKDSRISHTGDDADVAVVANEESDEGIGDPTNGLQHNDALSPGKGGRKGAKKHRGKDLWSCLVCTLLNESGSQECEACLSPKPQGAAKTNADTKSPYGQNDSEAGQSSNGVAGPDWECSLCTFQNKSKAEECEACTQRKPANTCGVDVTNTNQAEPAAGPQGTTSVGRQPELQSDEVILLEAATNEEGNVTKLEVPQEDSTLRAGALPEKKEQPLIESAEYVQDRTSEQELAGPSSPLLCGVCSSYQTADTFCLDGCSHRFCTACLKAAVKDQLAALPPVETADLQQAFSACSCPCTGCQVPLTQRDLILTAGEEQACSHQRWLYQVLTRAYGGNEAGGLKCACGEEELARVKASQLASLTLKNLRRALKARGLDPSGKHPECVQRLSDVIAVNAPAAVEQWLCIGCPERSCAVCNMGLRAPGHDCNRAVCGNALRALVELEKAYKACLVSTGTPASSRATKKQKTAHKPSPSAGVWAAGTGYGGNSDYNHHQVFWGMLPGGKHKKAPQPAPESAAETKAKEAEKSADARLAAAMDSLILCLSGGVGDGLVTALSLPLVAVVHESGIPARVLRALLLNDSMLDVSQRGALYLKALQLMRVLGAREELLPVICASPPKKLQEATTSAAATAGTPPAEVAKPIPPEPVRRSDRRADKKGKRKVEEEKPPAPTSVTEKEEDETEGTVLDAMEKLYKQATVVKVGLMGEAGDEGGSDELDIGLVCEICDAFEELQKAKKGWEEARSALRSAQGLGVSDAGVSDAGVLESSVGDPEDDEDCVIVDRRRRKGKKVEAPVETPEEKAKAQAAAEAAYKAALKDLQFRMEPLENAAGKADHYFREKKNAIDNGGVHSRARMLAISKEIGSLVTTLPLEWGSSIYLRVDDQRMDLVKALIIGPGGTPYQNGAFLFDILLPPDYPQVSPLVQFMTTGGGRTRFNPNLYADGKVCLSILGTWAGPGWQPGKSTLMQVLLSIQGMIFVADPYFNEPGYESHGNKTASNNYNHNQRRNTLQLAVLGMLKHPPKVFADVIQTHFRLKRQEIEAQCEEWAKDDFQPKAAPKPSKKPPKAPKNAPKKFIYPVGMGVDDEDDDEYAMGGGAMGGFNMDYETGRGSPIEATRKEILAELAKL